MNLLQYHVDAQRTLNPHETIIDDEVFATIRETVELVYKLGQVLGKFEKTLFQERPDMKPLKPGNFERYQTEIGLSIGKFLDRMIELRGTERMLLDARARHYSVKSSAMLQAALGIVSEAGETALEVMQYTNDFREAEQCDADIVLYELGDLHFYADQLAHALNSDTGTVLEMNVKKRAKRYAGAGFTSEESMLRRDETEKESTNND